MKFGLNKILCSSILFFAYSFCYADAEPPPPAPPPPPGLPVDGGILALLFVSLSYGLYKLYKFNFNKKNPV